RTSFRRSAPATCPTRRLPTPRSLPCGLSGTSRTRSPRCADGSSTLSLLACHVARAAAEQPGKSRLELYDAVVLAQPPQRWRYAPWISERAEQEYRNGHIPRTAGSCHGSACLDADGPKGAR